MPRSGYGTNRKYIRTNEQRLTHKSKNAISKATRSRNYKTFFMLNSTEHEIATDHKDITAEEMKTLLASKLWDGVFILLMNVKLAFQHL